MKNVFIKINFSTVSNQSAGPTEVHTLSRLAVDGHDRDDLWHSQSQRLNRSALRLPVRIARELVAVLKFLEEFPFPRLPG